MARDNLGDLITFMAIAQERSFTRAAAKLGVSQSTLSHAMTGLEERLGVRLLTRTTRSVSPTDAGEQLLEILQPRFAEIASEVRTVVAQGESLGGAVRLAADEYAAETVVWPRLAPLLASRPEIVFELSTGLPDFASGRHDLAVVWGDVAAEGVESTRIGPDVRMVVVGSPSYLERCGVPREPDDLLSHDCVTVRLAGQASPEAWRLSNDGHAVQARVKGQAVFSGVYQALNAAIDGLGLAYVPEDTAAPHLATGRLRPVMEKWSAEAPGPRLLHLGESQQPKAARMVADALRKPMAPRARVSVATVRSFDRLGAGETA